MGPVYLMDEQSRTTQLERILCKNEDKELQRLLELNFDLLPGDQIDPDEKRQWFLIKREMPVVDPSTGITRWSIDFLLSDQFGIPTLVECKRFDDSRSRREVVGQMMEYAANGHHYWKASDMRSYAESSAGGADQLESRINALRGDGTTVEQIFLTIEQNLREGKLRLIFFLEESPFELRSVVDFMNRQMKDTEVLIVEARQYQHGSDRIVVPCLFGFTEEARVAKRDSRAQTMRSPLERGEQAFWKAIEATVLNQESLDTIRLFILNATNSPGSASVWMVSWILQLPEVLATRGLFAMRRDGALELYFGYWQPSKYKDIGERQVEIYSEFLNGIEEILNIKFSDTQRVGFPLIPLAKWVHHERALAGLVQRLVLSAQATLSSR